MTPTMAEIAGLIHAAYAEGYGDGVFEETGRLGVESEAALAYQHSDTVQRAAAVRAMEPTHAEKIEAIGRAAEVEQLAQWAMHQGYSIGRADTLGELLDELLPQLEAAVAAGKVLGEGWVIVDPNGNNSNRSFITEESAWVLSFNWPPESEILAMKADGYRAVRVRLVEC